MNKDIHILLVEDNAGDARLIREMLIDNSAEPVTLDQVETLEEAKTCLEENQYDCILLDLSLPDSHGIDTVMQIEAEATDTPIVVLTGNDDNDLGIESVQSGAQDYLPKSDVDGRLLVRSLRYAIERHRSEMALRRSQEEYRSLIDDVFDTSMVAVLILDKDFHVVWCNEATEIYFGIERERLLGRDKRQLIDDELKCLFADPDDYAAQLLKAYDEGIFTERFECHVIPEGDRVERWLEHWSQPIRDGLFAGGRIEQYNDITERKQLEIAEKEQRQFTEALSDINSVLTSSLKLNDVFEQILTNLGRVVPHDSASITLIEDDHFRIAEQISMGNKRDTQKLIAARQSKVDYKPYVDTMIETAQPMVIADVQHDGKQKPISIESSDRSYVGSPILLQDEVIGFIHLLHTEPDFFMEEHAERLSAFSRLAAIAIQNARLFEQSRQLAAHEERHRIARELHDSVSQTLFTCRAMSESALKRWHKDPDGAFDLIRNVNQLSMTALFEMRILLLELRPHSLMHVGLKQLFEQYLRPIQERREFDLILSIDDNLSLTPDVQIGLYRITQEALNNIDKHAQATRVEVSVSGASGQVTLSISDNGIGFDIDQTNSTALGLNIMRERASEINASITIKSKPKTGTQIEVIVNEDDS